MSPSGVSTRQVIDYIKYKSKVFAVPQFYQPPAIMLNERVMKAAGVTDADIDTSKPDTLIAAVKKMTMISDGNPTRIGFDAQATGQSSCGCSAYGGQDRGRERQADPDDPDNAKALDAAQAALRRRGRLRQGEELQPTRSTSSARTTST